jgi:hypothetical protein
MKNFLLWRVRTASSFFSAIVRIESSVAYMSLTGMIRLSIKQKPPMRRVFQNQNNQKSEPKRLQFTFLYILGVAIKVHCPSHVPDQAVVIVNLRLARQLPRSQMPPIRPCHFYPK